ISSLIIFPTVTSMKVCKSFRSVVITSTVISVFCFISGLIFSVGYETPTGASVVCFNIFMLFVFSVISKINTKFSNNKKTLKRILSVISVFAFSGIYLSVILFGNSGYKFGGEGLSVVTTAFAQYDFARNIVGDKGEVYMLLSPGEESHTYEPTPAEILRIKECDVFVYGGGESEKWVDSILESLDGKIRTVKMMECVELHEEKHGDEEIHEHDHSHENQEYDEHVWTSPANAVIITRSISNEIIRADADNEEYYLKNTENFIRELENLDGRFTEMVNNSKNDFIIIGDRFPLRYLTERYGIEYHSAFPGCSAQVEANPATVTKLIKKVDLYNIPVVFKVDLGTGNIAESISQSTGAEVRTLYSCHTISSDDFERGESYISLMEKNLDNIAFALN
ncbi:MAG: zinc ABC transporter substrate-binding protein, partial [Clostridia bacterium]|nr:zinc ABC transporter substrate-binding protein [Clostridia bacterium]